MQTTQTQDLARLARERSFDALDEAWLALAEQLESAPLAPALAALDELETQREYDRVRTLVSLLLPGLQQAERWADVVELARRWLRCGGDGDTVRAPLCTALGRLHADRPGFEAYLRRSGLERCRSDEVAQALERLDAFLGFPLGQHVYHASGWGVGRVVEVVPHSGDLVIDFAERRGHRIPIEGAVQFLERLEDTDIRAQIFSNLEGLRELADTDPAELIRLCVRSFGGQAPVARIKQALIGPVFDTKAWSRLWQRAKRALVHDPHVHISPGSRPVITLRERPQTFAEQVVEELGAAKGIAQAVKIGRRFLREAHAHPDRVDREGIEAVARALRTGLSALAGRLEGEEAGAAYEAVQVVRGLEELGASAQPLPEALTAPPEDAQRLVATALGIRDAKSRRRYLEEAAEALGERFVEIGVQALQIAPREVFAPVLELLRERAPERAAQALERLVHAADPRPEALLALARESFAGRLDDLPGAPAPFRVLERLVAMFEKYERRRSGGESSAPNLRPQVRALLEPRNHEIVRRYFQQEERGAVKHMFDRIMSSHALDDEVREAARSVVARRFPELLSAAGGRFWEEDRVYATRRGIERQAERLRELKHDRMNEVAKAIGDAAAFGDLSENAEFTAALEERDRLVARIERMQKELEGAVALEEMHLPKGVVTPGQRVVLEVEGGGTETYTILGPWDVDESAGVISYTAPLAAGLLGRAVGEDVVIALPDGTRRPVRIRSVEKAI